MIVVALCEQCSVLGAFREIGPRFRFLSISALVCASRLILAVISYTGIYRGCLRDSCSGSTDGVAAAGDYADIKACPAIR